MSDLPSEDPRFLAAIKMLERTGMREFRIGHTPEDDGEPVVWYATAMWMIDRQTGKPVARYGHKSHEAAAAMQPVAALFRLCDQVVTDGRCAHCGQPTIFDENPSDSPLDALLNAMGCVYAYDPELQVFRRGCEGDER
jgi:hypothetical protein